MQLTGQPGVKSHTDSSLFIPLCSMLFTCFLFLITSSVCKCDLSFRDLGLVKGVGDIKLKLHDGSVKILPEVRYIPSLKRNLISLGMLEARGYGFKSENGELSVTKGENVILKGFRNHSLYYLDVKPVIGTSNITTMGDMDLWHMRLCHIGQTGLNQLIKHGAIPKLKNSEMKMCEHCILGKSKKAPYQKGIHTSRKPLDYAHCDLWGPAKTESLSGGRYFLSIMDDYSRKVWVYILKTKTEAFKKFKEWCREVELEKGTTLKCLRTDNGLEFLSEEFKNFCSSKGIKRHRTVPGNPQQNGVIERMNRTLLERVRCLLSQSGMPKKFWGEAVSTAAYVINKCPSFAVESLKCPDELWYGKPGNYTHLRVFGCRAFAHIRKDKLEPRAIKCVMLGYPSGTKGYRLWVCEPGQNKVIISRDVVFVESKLPYLSEEQKRFKNPVTEPTTSEVKVEVQNPSEAPEIGSESSSDEEGLGSQADEDFSTETNLDDYQLARDRERRQINPPARYSQAEVIHFALSIAEEIDFSEPATYEEAMKSKEWRQWLKAMQEEIRSLLKNGTWILVANSKEQKCVSCKWIFKKKKGEIRVVKVSTEENAADMLTKPLPTAKFNHCLKLVSLVSQEK